MHTPLARSCHRSLLTLLVFFLAVSLLACAKPQALESNPETESQATNPSQAPSPTAQPTLPPTPTPLPVAHSRLTGLALAGEAVQERPLAVMINNIKVATPQMGVGAADVLFETEVEGGITRMLAVFESCSQIPELGSIRSARHNYIDLANGLDAILVHVGGSYAANDQFARQQVVHIDLGAYSAASWRDADWKAQRGTEHSVKTTGERLQAVLDAHSSWRTSLREDQAPLFVFRDPDAFQAAAGDPASQIRLPFSPYVTATFSYDPDRQLYTKGQFGAPHMDLADGQALAFTNVLLLQTAITSFDGKVLRAIDLSQGTGFYASGGSIEPIRWSKGDSFDPLLVQTAAGQDLVVNAGKSYIAFASDKQTVSWDP